VLGTALAICATAVALGLAWRPALAAGFILSISLAYLPRFFQTADHSLPLYSYWFSLGAYVRLRPDITGQLIYFADRYWPGGSHLCFPYHFFFKNTLPFLALLSAGVVLGLARKNFLPR